MNNVMTYKGYTAWIEYDDEDKIFTGQLIGLQDIVVFHGNSVQELQTALHQSVDGYLDACQQLGQLPQTPVISSSLREDMEDYLIATRRMRDIQSGKTTTIPHEDVMKEYAINN